MPEFVPEILGKAGDIERAAEFIREGGLVAFPTETVYGLGGDALNRKAVAKIYTTKGRPGDNPLILHVANPDGFSELAHDPPEYAFALIKAFWPGPLTLVAQKKPHLPRWLGGHPDLETETIGIRMPEHPVARALIKAAGRPIAAPSANKAGKPSPTTAAHVLEDFPNPEAEGIMVLDGGSVSVGLESTVVDITGDAPRILRPGAVTPQMIHDTTGLEALSPDSSNPASSRTESQLSHVHGSKTALRSPGMKYRHYAPRAPMTILSGEAENVAAYIMKEHQRAAPLGQIVGALIPMETYTFFSKIPTPPSLKAITICEKLSDSEEIARNLFSSLRRFDKLGTDIIYAQAVPASGLGAAIMDRLQKASEGRVVFV
ncbi:MAG: L-threonylcarbamoyladenylate synthase [Defluviitaleaceae bacterium]|nr:L-threonylcarbamoyladenylate synthase [Defluviitaleaceae bacterium]